MKNRRYHVNVWQKPLQYCKVISFQLIKINEKKLKPLCTMDRCKMVQPLRKTIWQLFKKIKYKITIWSSISTSGYKTQTFESRVFKTYTHTHIHSSIISNSQKVKQPKCPSPDEQIKQNVIYICNRIII